MYSYDIFRFGTYAELASNDKVRLGLGVNLRGCAGEVAVTVYY